MKDPKHIMKQGRCRRCACGLRDNAGNCPPGFWMTHAEIAKWESAKTYAEQNRIEREAADLHGSVCPECNGKQVVERLDGPGISLPIFCGACDATGRRRTTSAQPGEKP